MSGIAPRWTGIWAAWASSRPAASKRAHEWSRRSLILGEWPVRSSAAPISSAMDSSRCRQTSTTMGSKDAKLRVLEFGS